MSFKKGSFDIIKLVEQPESLSKMTNDEFYTAMITEAPYIPGDIEPLILATEIPWINPDLISSGMEFAQRNYFAIANAHTAALMFGLSLKSESLVLLRTGQFHKKDGEIVWRRLINTAKRVGCWYHDSILNPESQAYQSCKVIRRIHKHAANLTNPIPCDEELQPTEENLAICAAMRDDLDFVDTSEAPEHILNWNVTLPLSQFDMAMTLFGFIGVVFMFPTELGVDKRGIDGFLHLWAVIARLLGLQDRFNLALYPDAALFQRFYINIVIASLKSSDTAVIALQSAMMNGLRRRVLMFSMKAWLYMGLKDGLEFYKGENLYALMTFYDKLCLAFLFMGKKILKHVPLFGWFMTKWLKFVIWFFLGLRYERLRTNNV